VKMVRLDFHLKRKIVQAIIAPLLGRRRSWNWLAQRAELHFHQNNAWRQTDEFLRHSEALFEHFGFARDSFADKTLVDLGAGSRLRTAYFRDARIVVIEPLADEFRRTVPWCDLDRASAVFCKPAEERIAQLAGTADGLISINVLDHCYDLQPILTNVSAYLRPSAVAFLSFDSHDETDMLHPLKLEGETVERAIGRTDLVLERRSFGLGPLGPMYGHGRAANYWLRKPA
jgi:hypothetical protein